MAEPAITQGDETGGVTNGTWAAKVTERKSAETAEKALSDAEITAVIEALNTGEMDQARVAREKAKAPQIREYAGRVIGDHEKAKQATDELAQREGIEPVGSSVANDVSQRGAGLRESLQDAAPGERFDRLFLETQIRQHRDLIGLLDARLIPSARDERLEIELLRLRAMVDRHLTQAQNLYLTL